MALPVTNHTITVTIDGTNRSGYLRANSLFIRSSITNNGDVAEFTVIDDGTWQILDWQAVTIAINGTTVFGGYIVSSNGVAEGDAAHKTTFWSVECRDWSAIFDTVLVDVTYISETTDILDEANCIDFLFDTYLSGEGFDYASQINSHYNGVIKITFDKISLRDALNKLADYTKAQWHVSPTKVLYYYNETDPSAAAFNIDTVAPNNSTTFDVLAKSLRATTDSIEIVNKVVVVGGTGQSRTRYADAFTQDTLVIVYGPLTKEPSAFYSVTYTTSDDIAHTVFADQIGIYPQETTDDLGNIITPAEQYYPVIANVDTHYIEFDISPSTLKNGATITVEYYYKEPISIVREDAASQSLYGRVFTRAIFDDSLVNLEMAARHGDKILEDYANGRVTVQFDITRFGLLPGRLLTINTPAFAINPLLGGLFYRSDRGGYFLLESGSDRIALEQYDEPRNFIIQEVAIQTVAVRQNEFMIFASVTAGFWRRSIVDTMRDLSNASASSAVNRSPTSLSQISPNLGEILNGRAVFTNGGTANFEWYDFADHTGVVMGLDSSAGSVARGAFYILDGGTVRTKIGYLNGFGSAGTVPTSGWGIWTNNGYFTGVVAASQLIGGTITGNQITGGTITGGLLTASTVSASRVSGGTVTGSLVTAGTVTGNLVTAGTITSSQISGGTITGAQLSGGTVTGGLVSGGTVTGNLVTAGTITSSQISGGTITAAQLSGGTVTGSLVTAGTITGNQVTGGTITAAQLSGGTITGGLLTAGTVSASRVSGGTVTGSLVTAGTVTGNLVTAGTITSSQISGGTITAAQLSGGTVTGGLVSGGTVSVVGGSVSISNTEGFRAIVSSTEPNQDARSVLWKTSSGSVVNEVGAYRDGTINVGMFSAGQFDSVSRGAAVMRALSNASGTLNVGIVEVRPTLVRYDFQVGYAVKPALHVSLSGIDVASGTITSPSGTVSLDATATRRLTHSSGSVQIASSLVPTATNTYHLGNSVSAFRHLYLDSNSVGIYRLYVNSSGSLVVEHV